MSMLSLCEVEKLIKGLEYSFKKRDSKESRSANLNAQIVIRDNMINFIKDDSRAFVSGFELSGTEGELIFKKLEYRFKNNLANVDLFEKLKS